MSFSKAFIDEERDVVERASTTTSGGYANCAESDILAVWNQVCGHLHV